MNTEKYFAADGQVKTELLDRYRWLAYLTQTDNIYVNAERVERIQDISGRETVQYVMRTLDILDELMPEEETEKALLREVLCWSEVAKGGRRKERADWRQKGYPLDIHNLASAEIFKDEKKTMRRIMKVLVRISYRQSVC